jgi:hypothetical protein
MMGSGIGISGDGLLPSHEESHDLSLFRHKLKAAQGIAYLSESKYKMAAATFTSISSELTNQFSSVISAEDLALYGALLGWATLDREMVCEVVMEGVFKARLEVSVGLFRRKGLICCWHREYIDKLVCGTKQQLSHSFGTTSHPHIILSHFQ